MAHSSAPKRTSQRTVLPPGCARQRPASGGALEPAAWAAARAQMAPPGASAIRLCRYAGLTARRRFALIRSRLVRQGHLVTELLGEFDALPRLPRGVINCPEDDRSQIVALLAYPGGHELTISVGLSGCGVVTNGGLLRTALGFGSPPSTPLGPDLLAKLEGLTGGATSRQRATVPASTRPQTTRPLTHAKTAGSSPHPAAARPSRHPKTVGPSNRAWVGCHNGPSPFGAPAPGSLPAQRAVPMMCATAAGGK